MPKPHQIANIELSELKNTNSTPHQSWHIPAGTQIKQAYILPQKRIGLFRPLAITSVKSTEHTLYAHSGLEILDTQSAKTEDKLLPFHPENLLVTASGTIIMSNQKSSKVIDLTKNEYKKTRWPINTKHVYALGDTQLAHVVPAETWDDSSDDEKSKNKAPKRLENRGFIEIHDLKRIEASEGSLTHKLHDKKVVHPSAGTIAKKPLDIKNAKPIESSLLYKLHIPTRPENIAAIVPLRDSLAIAFSDGVIAFYKKNSEGRYDHKNWKKEVVATGAIENMSMIAISKARLACSYYDVADKVTYVKIIDAKDFDLIFTKSKNCVIKSKTHNEQALHFLDKNTVMLTAPHAIYFIEMKTTNNKKIFDKKTIILDQGIRLIHCSTLNNGEAVLTYTKKEKENESTYVLRFNVKNVKDDAIIESITDEVIELLKDHVTEKREPLKLIQEYYTDSGLFSSAVKNPAATSTKITRAEDNKAITCCTIL